MATVYFDIKKSEFYTTTRQLYPYSFTEFGTANRTLIENYIRSVEQHHISSFGDVISFNLTAANANTLKISSAPFEVDKDNIYTDVFRIKYGYVAMFPRHILNSLRLFRSWVYTMHNADKMQNALGSNLVLLSSQAYVIPVLDITYKKDYNSYSSVAEFKIQKLS